jgi:hypothetical protein
MQIHSDPDPLCYNYFPSKSRQIIQVLLQLSQTLVNERKFLKIYTSSTCTVPSQIKFLFFRYEEQGGTAHGILDIPVGASSHCMPAPATFSLQPLGCHQFHPDGKATRWSPISGKGAQKKNSVSEPGP